MAAVIDPSHSKATASMEPGPMSRRAAKLLTAGAAGTALLFLSGLTLAGTVVGLVVATPVLVVFSPVLLPAGAVALLAAAGLLLSGGFGVAAVSAVAWIYNYVAGKRPPGSDKVDSARAALARKARDVREKAREYRQYVQHKAQGVAGDDAGVDSS